MRIETIGNATLYLGDASDVIDDLQAVDALITDPPYGINGSNGTIGKKRNKGGYTGLFEDTPEYINNVVVPIISKGLSISIRAAVTPGGKNSGLYPNPNVVGGYVQKASSGLCSWGACTLQPIFFYGRDPRIGKDITPITYYLNEAPPKIDHPCPKPQKSWTWLVHKATLEGETVFDPFMGSGTTGISCVTLGRKFIGVELDEKYFDIACERIQKATNQPDLFIDRERKQKSAKLDL